VTPTILVHDDEADRYAALIRVPPRHHVEVRTARTAEQAAPLVGDADVLFAWKFPSALYAKAGRLRWLQVMGAGVDWALTPELPDGVTLTRAPGIFGSSIAEYVLGWCTWVTQRMGPYLDAQRERRWLKSMLPGRLRGTTLTIVGLGDVGRAIAGAARAFDMRVLGVSRSGRPARHVHRVYASRHLSRALAASDFVVLAVPLTPATRHLIGRRELEAMKPGAWLLNVARGAVVDDTALIDALHRHRIAGAILDVFAVEPLPGDHPLWTTPNVVITPHVAGPSIPEEIAPIFNDNLARFLRGRPLRHIVNRRRGY
jgi:glyoxylate/hydroxypyruvate reductase A